MVGTIILIAASGLLQTRGHHTKNEQYASLKSLSSSRILRIFLVLLWRGLKLLETCVRQPLRTIFAHHLHLWLPCIGHIAVHGAHHDTTYIGAVGDDHCDGTTTVGAEFAVYSPSASRVAVCVRLQQFFALYETYLLKRRTAMFGYINSRSRQVSAYVAVYEGVPGKPTTTPFLAVDAVAECGELGWRTRECYFVDDLATEA